MKELGDKGDAFKERAIRVLQECYKKNGTNRRVKKIRENCT